MIYIGGIIGFFVVRFFLLTDLEVMWFKMFLHILREGSPLPGSSRLNAINFNSLTSDTSLKLIFGTLSGGLLVHWYQSKKEANSNKEHGE